MEPLRVGLLGVRDGVSLLRACRDRDDVEVVGICDSSIEQLSEASRTFDVPQVYTDEDKLLAIDGLDAVLIATPDRLHRRQVLAALAAGRHVYCVAPAEQTLAGCRSLLKGAALQADRFLMIGHLWRLHPFFSSVEAKVRAGELGRVYSVRLEQYTSGVEYEQCDWRADGVTGSHPFLTHGSSLAELAAALGGELLRVHARSSQRALLELPFDDTFEALFETADGCHISCFLAVGAHRSPAVELRLLGTDGAVCGNSANRRNDCWQASGAETTRHALPGDPSPAAVAAGLHEFVVSIRQGRLPVIGVRDGCRAVAAALAAIESAESGGRPVDLERFDR